MENGELWSFTRVLFQSHSIDGKRCFVYYRRHQPYRCCDWCTNWRNTLDLSVWWERKKNFSATTKLGTGVAYWPSPKRDKDRIIYITPGHLVALDAGTGQPIADFGNKGIAWSEKGPSDDGGILSATIGSTFTTGDCKRCDCDRFQVFPLAWRRFRKQR